MKIFGFLIKSVFFLLNFVLCYFGARAQYQVIQVTGRVTYNQTYLQPGSVIPIGAKLDFKQFSDSAKVIDAAGMTFILKKQQPSNKLQSLFNLKLSSKTKMSPNLPTREKVYDELEQIPTALFSFVAILVEQENRYPFDRNTLTLGPGGKFMLYISLNGDTIKHSLKIEHDTLILRYIDFLSEYGFAKGIRFGLWFQPDSLTAARALVPHFKTHFDLTNDMEGIIQTTVSNYKKRRMSRQLAYIQSLTQVYYTLGKPAPITFAAVFNSYYSPGKDSLPRKQLGYGTVNNFNRSSLPRNLIVYTNSKKLRRGRFNDFHLFPRAYAATKNRIPALDPASSLLLYAPDTPGYQGKANTCTAWAAAYGAATINYNVSSKNHPKRVFSPEFVYNLVDKNAQFCNKKLIGISIPAALSFLSDTGDIAFADTVFECGKGFTETIIRSAGAFKTGKQQLIFQFNDFIHGIPRGLVDTIRKKIFLEKKPVIFSMMVPNEDDDWFSTNYNSFQKMGHKPFPTQWQPLPVEVKEMSHRNTDHLSHTLVIIGYNDAINDGSFEVLNSWGTKFGRNGCFWLNYEDFMRFALDAFCLPNPPKKNSTNAAVITHRVL